MQQQRNGNANPMEDAKQMIAIFNKRIQSLATSAATTATPSQHHQNKSDTLTNDRFVDYELEGIDTQLTINKWLRIAYYILAVYCIILLWTQWSNTGGIIKKILITILIMFIPMIIMPLLKFAIKQIKWVWGLLPTNVRIHMQPA